RGQQLLHAVLDRLHVHAPRARPGLPAAGALREILVNEKTVITERVLGIGGLMLAVVAPLVFNEYWIDVILTQALIMGIAAASLIFLAAHTGQVQLAETA